MEADVAPEFATMSFGASVESAFFYLLQGKQPMDVGRSSSTYTSTVQGGGASAAAASENLTDEDINILYAKIHSCEASRGLENFSDMKGQISRLPPSQVGLIKSVIENNLALLVSLDSLAGAPSLGVKQLSELLSLPIFQDDRSAPTDESATRTTTTTSSTSASVNAPPRPPIDLGRFGTISISYPKPKPLPILAFEASFESLVDDMCRGIFDNGKVDAFLHVLGALNDAHRATVVAHLENSCRYGLLSELKRTLQRLDEQAGVATIERIWLTVVDLRTRDSKEKAFGSMTTLFHFIIAMNRALGDRGATPDETNAFKKLLFSTYQQVEGFQEEFRGFRVKAPSIRDLYRQALAELLPEDREGLLAVMSESNPTHMMIMDWCNNNLGLMTAHMVLSLKSLIEEVSKEQGAADKNAS